MKHETYIYKNGTKYKATIYYRLDHRNRIELLSGIDENGEEFDPENFKKRLLGEIKP